MKEHQKYIDRRQKELERLKLQRLLDDIDNYNEAYQKHIERFKELVITEKDFIIAPILDVWDMYQEGKILHHCVFTNRYFEEKDSLILSARMGDKRFETIEVNLKKVTIVQAHGLMNLYSDYHNDIIVAVNNYLPVIKQMLKKRKLKQAA